MEQNYKIGSTVRGFAIVEENPKTRYVSTNFKVIACNSSGLIAEYSLKPLNILEYPRDTAMLKSCEGNKHASTILKKGPVQIIREDKLSGLEIIADSDRVTLP